MQGLKVPIKTFVSDAIPIEQTAHEQLYRLSGMPFLHSHIAVMPDVHWGMGSTVGSVIATTGAIIPAAVGVDIGCGMIAQKTVYTASDLPDSLLAIRREIERQIPHGRSHNGGARDIGSFGDLTEIPKHIFELYFDRLDKNYWAILCKHPKIETKKPPILHLGTLGTGNHFVELCLDQNDCVWIMLHSGSRGIGNRIGSYFIEKAKEEMHRYYIKEYLPDQDLSYLVEHTEIFDDYLEAVQWAQEYAFLNRQIMMYRVNKILKWMLGETKNDSVIVESAINCHHNYVQEERHFGKTVWITRKGAVKAELNDLGIIPGSMGAKSFIVRGKGNRDSFKSCSHGAGRVMSRTEAKKFFTIDDHINATAGVECRKDIEVIDETPGAYKDIDAVMAAQSDLVDIVYTLKQVLCVKG